MSWFGKSGRKPNLAETLLNNTNNAVEARKKRLAGLVQPVVNYIVEQITFASNTERNPSSYELTLENVFLKNPVASLVAKFNMNNPLFTPPTLEELSELANKVRAVLEEPAKYGFKVVTGSGTSTIIRIDWSEPVVPVEPVVEVKVEVKPEVKSEPAPETKETKETKEVKEEVKADPVA